MARDVLCTKRPAQYIAAYARVCVRVAYHRPRKIPYFLLTSFHLKLKCTFLRLILVEWVTQVLIMDEVDGMSGSAERGGMADLMETIKLSKIPIICICNDAYNQKVRLAIILISTPS